MKAALLLLASFLVLSPALRADEVSTAGAEPAAAVTAAAPDPAPSLDDLWARISTAPAPHAAAYTCTGQILCPNGRWLGCYGYNGPDSCESMPYCVMCDGVLYYCPNAFCPH